MRPARGALWLLVAVAGSVIAASDLVAEADDWSLENATFIFTSSSSGNADLWLQHGAAGVPEQITADEAQDHAADWFPDGRRIAFQTLRDGQREIYVVGTDGSGAVNLTQDPAQDLLPDVSPDGHYIVFFSDRGLEHGPQELPGHLYLMDSGGGGVERLTAEPLTSTFGGDWSPDGRSILFARDFDGDIDLVLLDLQTLREERLPGTAAAEYGGRFSPDGRQIAFHASAEGDESRIVVMELDGTGRREITRGAQHYGPRWSPDGRWLMFTGAASGAAQFDLMIVPAAGGQTRTLVATSSDERGGSWSPES